MAASANQVQAKSADAVIRATTDGTTGSPTYGQVIGQQGHYPFGESWYSTGTTTKWQFTSYERDGGTTESGNDYAMARSYVNRLGRFSSPDPLGGPITDPQSLNRYAYVRNDPANLVDPLGLRETIYTPPVYVYATPDGFSLPADGGGVNGGLARSHIAYLDPIGDPGGGDKLKDELRKILENPECAKWLGGQERASAILGKFAGVKDVSPGSDWIPRNPGQMQAQADINSNRAIAMNDSRPGPGGGWNGRPFAVFAGTVFNQQSQPAQLTVVIHELAHVAWKGTPMGKFIDINNGLSSAFWISRDCGNAVPEWDNWKVPQ